MPDYEIKCWDANSFDFNSVPFVKGAYEAKKWAFMADYIRIYALHMEGGIYLDSDVETFRRFDDFLDNDFFIGTEPLANGVEVESAIMGSVKGHPYLKECLDYYNNLTFSPDKAFLDANTCPQIMSRILEKYGYQYTNTTQYLRQGIKVYDRSFFGHGWTTDAADYYAIHYFNASWLDYRWGGAREAVQLLQEKRFDEVLLEFEQNSPNNNKVCTTRLESYSGQCVPKIIHCVWLSGSEKPLVYRQCIDTWKDIMPDYEIREWSMKNLPAEVLNHTFVASAIGEQKWAYATDYIRLWVLFTYGGIYMDMDVMVFKPFDAFLHNRAFSSIEFNPRHLYKTLRKKEIIGCGIEAAVLGCEKGHPWIRDIMEKYNGLTFINDPKFYWNIIMPRMMTRLSIEKYGFKIVPVYQVLKEDIHIYPSDVFSSIYNMETVRVPGNMEGYRRLGESPIRYSFHICAHSWWEGAHYGTIYKIKHLFVLLFGHKLISKIKSYGKLDL